MKKLFNLIEAIYYYLKVSFKIRNIKRGEKDDIVYVTRDNIQIEVYPGKKI